MGASLKLKVKADSAEGLRKALAATGLGTSSIDSEDLASNWRSKVRQPPRKKLRQYSGWPSAAGQR